MKLKMNQPTKILMSIIFVIGLIAFIPSTLSQFKTEDEITNPFALGTIDIEIEETFDPPEKWDGTTTEKKVQIQNVGSAEALIRVALVPRWENADGTPFAGDTQLIKLSVPASTTPGWVDGGDGYYYYNAKVLSGNLTVPLLSAVTIEITDFAQNERYREKQVKIDVKAETVHALKEAYEAVWPQMAQSGSATDTMLRTLIPNN